VLRSSSYAEPDLRSATLLTMLRARGWRARLDASESCGEWDVRIRIRRGPRGPAVELLCRSADEPEPPQWHAVRLTGDERTVWRGPAGDGALTDAVTFVQDLLVLDDAALAGRYLRLG
jgi:hypothetical protein